MNYVKIIIHIQSTNYTTINQQNGVFTRTILYTVTKFTHTVYTISCETKHVQNYKRILSNTY